MPKKKKISSKELGIDIASMKEIEIFKWFLACLLFGKPIQQQVARRTYDEFIKEGLTSPEAIIDAGWDKLVEVLDVQSQPAFSCEKYCECSLLFCV